MADYTLNDLNEVTVPADDDLIHIRNTSGLDKKVLVSNLRSTMVISTPPVTVVTSNITMEVNKLYSVTSAFVELTLPASATTSDKITISAKEECFIKQSDAEHNIRYGSMFGTSKGTSGKLHLERGDEIVLSYTGSGTVELSMPSGSIRTLNLLEGVPASKPSAQGSLVAFDRTGEYLSVGADRSPWIYNYKISGDTFTLLTTPSSLPTSRPRGLAWNPKYDTLLVGTDNELVAYKRVGDTFTLVSINTRKIRSIEWDDEGIFALYSQSSFSPYVSGLQYDGVSTFTDLVYGSGGTVPVVSNKKMTYSGGYFFMHNPSSSDTVFVFSLVKSDNNSDFRIISCGHTQFGFGSNNVYNFATNKDQDFSMGCVTSTNTYMYRVAGIVRQRMGRSPFTSVSKLVLIDDNSGLALLWLEGSYSKLYNIYDRYPSQVAKLNTADAGDTQRDSYGCTQIAIRNDGMFIALAMENSTSSRLKFVTIYKIRESVSKQWNVQYAPSNFKGDSYELKVKIKTSMT